MIGILILIILFVYFFINSCIGGQFQDAAFAKGYDTSAHAFGMCFWLGIIGCIYVAALPDLIAREQREKIINALGGSDDDDVIAPDASDEDEEKSSWDPASKLRD